MKVKLQSGGKLQLVKAVKEVLDLGLKEAKDLVDEQEKELDNGFCVIIDSEKTEEQIKAIAEQYGVTCTPIDERKLQEVTNDDLSVSIHSVDEMSIAWRRKMLFTHKQATRVIAGLHDAKFNVTEKLVMHEGYKVTMLVVSKTFPSGIKKKDLEEFENLFHIFVSLVCEMVNTERILEDAKESAIKAFNALRNYE